MRGNLKTLTRIKLCFDFLIRLISSEARYCVIFLPWHDILFWAMTALCCCFGNRSKGSLSEVGWLHGDSPSYLVGCSFWYQPPHQRFLSNTHSSTRTLLPAITDGKVVDVKTLQGVSKRSRHASARLANSVQMNFSMSLCGGRFIISVAKLIHFQCVRARWGCRLMCGV